MFNYGFELFVNLFQGVMFTVFCYKFLTPSRNKICEGIAFCVASLLMFLSITQINRLYVSFAYIETVVFLSDPGAGFLPAPLYFRPEYLL